MKKNELKTKLGLYSVASGAMALLANNAEAQVTYRDISPDATITAIGGSYFLDLNDDATNDFKFDFSDWGGGVGALYLNAVGAVGAGFVGVSDPSFTYKGTVLNTGTLISTTAPTGNNWVGSGMLAVKGSSANYGPFANATDKYIGLRIKTGADFIYGWVRVSISIGTPSVTIKDVAFNATVNTSISTAQTTATLAEQSNALLSKVEVTVNDQNEVTIVNNNNNSISASVVSLTGNTVATTAINAGVSNTIASNELKSGLYLVKITMDDTVAAVKVMIK